MSILNTHLASATSISVLALAAVAVSFTASGEAMASGLKKQVGGQVLRSARVAKPSKPDMRQAAGRTMRTMNRGTVLRALAGKGGNLRGIGARTMAPQGAVKPNAGTHAAGRSNGFRMTGSHFRRQLLLPKTPTNAGRSPAAGQALARALRSGTRLRLQQIKPNFALPTERPAFRTFAGAAGSGQAGVKPSTTGRTIVVGGKAVQMTSAIKPLLNGQIRANAFGKTQAPKTGGQIAVGGYKLPYDEFRVNNQGSAGKVDTGRFVKPAFSGVGAAIIAAGGLKLDGGKLGTIRDNAGGKLGNTQGGVQGGLNEKDGLTVLPSGQANGSSSHLAGQHNGGLPNPTDYNSGGRAHGAAVATAVDLMQSGVLSSQGGAAGGRAGGRGSSGNNGSAGIGRITGILGAGGSSGPPPKGGSQGGQNVMTTPLKFVDLLKNEKTPGNHSTPSGGYIVIPTPGVRGGYTAYFYNQRGETTGQLTHIPGEMDTAVHYEDMSNSAVEPDNPETPLVEGEEIEFTPGQPEPANSGTTTPVCEPGMVDCTSDRRDTSRAVEAIVTREPNGQPSPHEAGPQQAGGIAGMAMARHQGSRGSTDCRTMHCNEEGADAHGFDSRSGGMEAAVRALNATVNPGPRP